MNGLEASLVLALPGVVCFVCGLATYESYHSDNKLPRILWAVGGALTLPAIARLTILAVVG